MLSRRDYRSKMSETVHWQLRLGKDGLTISASKAVQTVITLSSDEPDNWI